MIALIIRYATGGYFRWFDSGDLQSVDHLMKIIEIAEATSHIKYWLPTQERQFLKGVDIPKNLTVRVSAPVTGKPLKRSKFPTSYVIESSGMAWEKRVADNTKRKWHCPSEMQGHKCVDCRACWDPEVKTIVYKKS